MYINKKLIPDYLHFNDSAVQSVIDRKVKALREYFDKSSFTKAVIGLSGGIDSAVALALTTRAIGPKNVMAIRLPFRSFNSRSMDIAAEIATACGLPPANLLTTDITNQVETAWSNKSVQFQPKNKKEADVRLGNLAARERMAVLMDAATHFRALLVGTENRTEEFLAYFTIGGDNISSIEPFQDLWKVQIFLLGEALGLPASVLNRAPSAELWDGQTDEGEIGVSYLDIDTILAGIEKGFDREQILNRYKIVPEQYDRVTAHVAKMEGKRHAPYRI